MGLPHFLLEWITYVWTGALLEIHKDVRECVCVCVCVEIDLFLIFTSSQYSHIYQFKVEYKQDFKSNVLMIINVIKEW